MAFCAYLPQTCSNTISIQKNSNICQTIHTAPVKSAPGHLFIVQLRTILRSDFLHHFGEQPNWAKAIIPLLLFVAAVQMYVRTQRDVYMWTKVCRVILKQLFLHFSM